MGGIAGSVQAGTQPVVGASVMLYAASQAGNGAAATRLLSAAVLTDQNGGFAVPLGVTCPLSNTVLYAVATGGAAVAGAAANPSTRLVTVLGTCASVQAGASVVLNEVTTVAAAYALAQFFGPEAAYLGATATNSSGIGLAAATASNLADGSTGVAPGSGFPANGTAPSAEINTLANLLHGCIVSAGAQSAACVQLYDGAYSIGGVPAGDGNGDTFSAVLTLAKNPLSSLAALFSLSQNTAAFAPALTAAPPDWTMAVSFGGGGMDGPSSVSIDSVGRVWVANYFESASLFTNTGVPVFAGGITGDNLVNSFGGAVDVNDSFWVANEESSGSLNNGLGSISVLASNGSLSGNYTTGGINFPLAVAFDTSGVSWVVDYGDSSLTLLDTTGQPLSGATGYTSASVQFPAAIATDAKCNAYVANQSSDTLTRVLADGSGFTDYTVGQGPSGVAIDAAGNIWSANYYGDSVGLVSAAGDVVSGSGFSGGGLDHPQGIAADGSGNVWVANYRAPGVSELASAAAATPGRLLSPAAGLGPNSGLIEAFGLAIDTGGNVWVTSFGTNTLTEFVGLAAPVKTPLLGPVRVP